MGAHAFLDRLISNIDAALHRRERRSDAFQQLPDRRLLREVFLPAFAEGGEPEGIGRGIFALRINCLVI